MKKAANIRSVFSLDYYYSVLRGECCFSNPFSDILFQVLAAIIVSIDRFVKDASMITASALTFYSIFAVIPGVALLLAIARGFGADAILQDWIRAQTYTDPEVMEWIMNFAARALDNTKSGWVTGLGIVLLLWSVIRMLAGTELAMNRIWEVRGGRSLGRQFTDYGSILFMVPIFIVLISSLNVFMMSNLKEYAMGEGWLGYASEALRNLLTLLPYILVWLLFLFLYMFIPTIPVRFRHALLAAVVSGSLFQVVQWFYIRFQIGVSSYNAIYGGLAALPLLLVWLQLSWSIVLWGTELCYVQKNRHFIYRTNSDTSYQWVNRVDLSIRVLKYISGCFTAGAGAATLASICKTLKISSSKARIVLIELIDAGFLEEVEHDDEIRYLPAVDFHVLAVSDIIIRLSQVDGGEEEWKKRFVSSMKEEFSKDTFA